MCYLWLDIDLLYVLKINRYVLSAFLIIFIFELPSLAWFYFVFYIESSQNIQANTSSPLQFDWDCTQSNVVKDNDFCSILTSNILCMSNMNNNMQCGTLKLDYCAIYHKEPGWNWSTDVDVRISSDIDSTCKSMSKVLFMTWYWPLICLEDQPYEIICICELLSLILAIIFIEYPPASLPTVSVLYFHIAWNIWPL